MSFTLNVRMKKAEGALLRLLGQVGRRGYDVLKVDARLTPDGALWEVKIEFEPIVPKPGPQAAPLPVRPPEVLPPLVAKLYEVVSVELQGASAPGSNGQEAPKPGAKKPPGEMHWEE